MYIILFLIYFSLYLTDYKKTRKKYLLSIIPLLVVIFIRYGIGTDYFSYNVLYDEISLTNVFNDSSEFGFNIIMLIFKGLGFNYHSFSTILLSITLIAYTSWIYDNSENVYTSLLIFYSFFFIVWVLSAYRQGFVMAIGVYLLFNRKIDLSIFNKVIIILLLTTIHSSALYFLIMLVFEKIALRKNTLILLYVSSVLLSFILVKIFPYFISNISFLSNNFYLKNYPVGWSLFPALIRSIFFVIMIYSYDYYQENTFYRRIYNVHMMGYPVYFILKFSELISGRIFAFTFAFIIILFPIFLTKIKKPFAIILVFTISFLYLVKDLNAYIDQVGYNGNTNFYTFQTVLNKDVDAYFNRYSIMVSSKDKEDEYIKYVYDNKTNDSIELLGPVVVREQSNYIILDKYGHQQYEEKFSIEPKVYDDIIETRINVSGVEFIKYIYSNGDEVNAHKVLREIPKDVKLFIENTYELQQYSNPKVSELPESVRKYFNTSITASLMYHFEDPFKYYALELEYFNSKYYFLLDENKNLIVDLILREPVIFNKQGLAKLVLKDIDVYIDRKGNVVWINEKK